MVCHETPWCHANACQIKLRAREECHTTKVTIIHVQNGTTIQSGHARNWQFSAQLGPTLMRNVPNKLGERQRDIN